MKNGAVGSGVQVWSSFVPSTLAEFRDAGFVDGANNIPHKGDEFFPCREAENAYNGGFASGAKNHRPFSVTHERSFWRDAAQGDAKHGVFSPPVNVSSRWQYWQGWRETSLTIARRLFAVRGILT